MKIKDCLEIKELDDERILTVSVFHVHRYKWYSESDNSWNNSVIVIYTDGDAIKEIETSEIEYTDELDSYAIIREYRTIIRKKIKREVIKLVYNPMSKW
jgi:hypothetical protein